MSGPQGYLALEFRKYPTFRESKQAFHHRCYGHYNVKGAMPNFTEYIVLAGRSSPI